MSEGDNEMGTVSSEAEPTEAPIRPLAPTPETPPPGEAPPPAAESPRQRRLHRAAGAAARLVRRGATSRGVSIKEEAERLTRAEPSPLKPTEAGSGPGPAEEPPEPPPETGFSRSGVDIESTEERSGGKEVKVHLFDPLDQYVDRMIRDNTSRQEIKEILASDHNTLLKRYLIDIGVEASKQDSVAELVRSSHVRLIMSGLRELGLAEDRVDEAHRIIMTEKGEIRIDHIIRLGFGAEEAETVHALLNESRASHVKEQLKKIGLDEDRIDQILFVGEDENKLVEANLAGLGIEEYIIDRILRFRENARVGEQRREELGYEDEDRIISAHVMGIPDTALHAAEKARVPIDLLIAAEKNGDMGLKEWLASKGIELKGLLVVDEDAGQLNRIERRQRHRELSRVPSLSPYPLGHPLYGKFTSGYPHVITRSETEYYRDMMRQRPGWLRNSLIRPGSLPLPKALYYSRLSRPFLDAINGLWVPMLGRRLLAGRIYRFDRKRKPNEDYGAANFGIKKRREHLDHIKLVDKTIRNDRSLLSWHRRHRNLGAIRRNPRLDLAQSIAEVNRDAIAFEAGRPEIPSEEEYTYVRLKDMRYRNEAQQKLLEELREKHPEFEY